MAKAITLSLPHNLSEAEVKSRMMSGIAAARSKHPEILKNAQESWTNNRMDFRATALGQSITGRADVRPQTVDISVELPVMLAILADRLRPQIESEARKLLGAPPPQNC
jgi:hypothetical protein